MSSGTSLATAAGAPSTLQELQRLLVCARDLHANLAEQLEQQLGLDPADVRQRYGHFPHSGDATAAVMSSKRRNRHKHPEPMNAQITAMEKRKMRLLLHSLRSSIGADEDDGGEGGGTSAAPAPAAAAMDPEVRMQQQLAKHDVELSVADLRGLSRASVALFERFVVRSADVADSDADSEFSNTGGDNTSGDTSTVTSATSSRVSSPARSGAGGAKNNKDADEDEEDDDDDDTAAVATQTAESSIQTVKLAERIMAGESDEAYGGMRSRRFPHRLPKPPLARGAYQPPKPRGQQQQRDDFGGDNASSASASSSSSFLQHPRYVPQAGQTYTAIAFRPMSLKQLQQQSGSSSAEDGHGDGSAGWSQSFFPVELHFSPGGGSDGKGRSDKAGGGGGGADGSSSSGGGTGVTGSSGSTADTEGAARLVVRRIPVTPDGQRFATSRADAAHTVIADVGCAALRSVVVGQATRFFLRGRMVLQKKSDLASKWAWKVPASLALHQQQGSLSSTAAADASKQQQQQQRVPLAIDFTTLPAMAQVADRCLSLAFVDATVLNLPAKSNDVEEDAALQAAAARASSLLAGGSAGGGGNESQDNNNNNGGGGPLPKHVSAIPPHFLPSAGAELALAFPSHAEFNAFLAESMHWAGDFAAFRYGRPADFHSEETLKSLPNNVRDAWQSLDGEELTFCEEFHIPPSVYLTAKRRVTASADPAKSMTSVDALLCEEDLAAICDVDFLQLSAMVRFLQARGFVKLHSLYFVRKPM